MILHLLRLVWEAVIIDINNLFQSFDPVRKIAGDCLHPESASDCLDDIEKLIDLGNRLRNERF
jgi:hypothetical protein